MLHRPTPMHIPDGFLSLVVSVTLWLVAALAIAVALRRANRDLNERQIPLMGVLAACIFAGQMLNFSVTGGTSGHLMGAALATILLGPWSALLVLTAVVGVQALIFQDGGLLALGANIVNMAVVGVFVAEFAHRAVRRLLGDGKKAILAGGFAAGWLSIFVASLGVALQLALSGTSPAQIAIPAMAAIHALIGIGEGLITAGALAFLYAARRDLVLGPSAALRRGPAWAAGLLTVVVLAALAPFASSHPDGLVWFAARTGFLDRAAGPRDGLLTGYALPGISDAALATVAAGLAGAVMVIGVFVIAAQLRRRRGPETD